MSFIRIAVTPVATFVRELDAALAVRGLANARAAAVECDTRRAAWSSVSSSDTREVPRRLVG